MIGGSVVIHLTKIDCVQQACGLSYRERDFYDWLVKNANEDNCVVGTSVVLSENSGISRPVVTAALRKLIRKDVLRTSIGAVFLNEIRFIVDDEDSF